MVLVELVGSRSRLSLAFNTPFINSEMPILTHPPVSPPAKRLIFVLLLLQFRDVPLSDAEMRAFQSCTSLARIYGSSSRLKHLCLHRLDSRA